MGIFLKQIGRHGTPNLANLRKSLNKMQSKLDIAEKSVEILKVTKDIRTIDKSIAKLKSSSSKHKIKRTKYASPSLHAVSSDSDEEILPINSSSHESLPPKIINMPETLTSEAQPPIITADINRPVVLTPFLRQPKVLFVKEMTQNNLKYFKLTYLQVSRLADINLLLYVRFYACPPG